MGILSKLTTDERRETPHIQDEVPADTTGHEVAWVAPADCTVEQLSLWAVPGSEDALQLRPVIRRIRGDPDNPESAEDTDIPSYGGGEQFVTGEPDGDRYHVNAEMRKGDRIVIITDNKSTDYAYRFRALPTVDYLGGIRRVIGGVF
ncbi:hypothetical protein [Haloferax volcanii]|uniref:Uncharacterized protein n=3 Tax=Haloferax volcanii TaxID=2246 RepID=A0A384LB80_HALVD|nr:hypothetical protein [Haloferax volcanii]ADE03522.1 uncharacterized protein HVO_0371 [Haloferax volcanii DS2]ELY25063.1 hypothetical protein C498_16848 [Haloferax volcanii DS2]MBS8119045.1 hypothetical protein [Haloferax volcanii]MBS8124058.1 hypothetical protein [Haloferax volcanii]MBS8127927.1 hypothetical protein [Haloferax volcanii]